MAAYYLIKNDDTYYTITDSALASLDITELTAQVFQESGISDPTAITAELLKDFTAFKILKWTDADAISLNASLTALPPPQTIVTEAIYLTDSTILGIEAVTAEYEGEPKVAVSFDGKATWLIHTDDGWGTLSEDTSGMSIETLASITTEQWAEKISNVDAIYMRIALSSAEDKVTTIVFDFVN